MTAEELDNGAEDKSLKVSNVQACEASNFKEKLITNNSAFVSL